MNESLSGLKLLKMRRELPATLSKLDNMVSHLKFLTAINLDARVLLEKNNDAKRMAIQVKHEFTSLLSDVSWIRRSGKIEDKNTLRSYTKNISKSLDELEKAIAEMNVKATDGINQPSRWGDGEMEGVFAATVDQVHAFLEFVGLLKAKQRLE